MSDGRNSVGDLRSAQMKAALNAVPLELTVVDAENIVRFWNMHGERQSRRETSALGRDLLACHSPSSRHAVASILEELRSGARDVVEKLDTDRRVSWHALRDVDGTYLGVLEAIQRFD